MATLAHEVGGTGIVSIGRIFSRAFSFMVKYPLITFGSALLFGALPSVLSQILVVSQATNPDGSNPNAAIGFLAVQLVLLIVSLVGSGLMQAIMTRGLVTAHEGHRPTFGHCLSQGLRFAVPVIGLMILWTLGVFVGFLFLVIPGIILGCMWAVAIPSLVEERVGVIGAFARSRELTRGHRWKIFGLLMVVIIAFYLVLAVLGLLGLAGASAGAVDEGSLQIAVIVSSALGGLVFGLLWATIQPSLFVELRDAKEGGGAGELAQVFG